MGDRGIARYIFLRTLLLQTGLATLATGGFLYWVLGDANPDYKLAAALLVLSIWPSMVNSISAQANMATEDLSTNLPASVVSMLIYLIAIAATVVFRWGVVGIGASTLLMRIVRSCCAFFPHAQARARLGDHSCSPARITQPHDSLRLAERCHHGGFIDRLGQVGDHSAEDSLPGYPPGFVLFAGIYHGRTVAAGRDRFRNGSRRHDLCSVRTRQVPASSHYSLHFSLSCSDRDSAALHRGIARGSGADCSSTAANSRTPPWW